VAALNQVVGDSLDAGREAIRKHAWPEAFELLSDADVGAIERLAFDRRYRSVLHICA
jgi:hypothetical protein